MATVHSSSEDDFNTTNQDNSSSCVACDRPDSADNMVACDQCNCWWHLSCAGVSAGVSNRPWTCSKCLPLPTKTISARTSSSVRKAKLNLELKRLEEEKEIEKRIEKAYVKERYRIIEESLMEEEDEQHSVHSRQHANPAEKSERVTEWVASQAGPEFLGAEGGTILRESSARLPLPEEAANEFPERRELIADAIRKLQQQLRDSDSLSSVQLRDCQQHQQPSADKLSELENQLQLCQRGLKGVRAWPEESIRLPKPFPEALVDGPTHPTGTIPKSKRVVAQPSQQKPSMQADRRQPTIEPECVAPELMFRPEAIPTSLTVEEPVQVPQRRQLLPPQSTRQIDSGVPVNPRPLGPTQEQRTARQVFSGDLPTFSGNPADWPVFISHYQYTTEACGFNNGENMIRLQRCLKGSAWESVRNRLIHPGSVPAAIKMLEKRYGRPDLIIETLIEKVRSTPPPKADRLNTIIDFGTQVQGLCEHFEAADLNDHLNNPSLLKELVRKLPTEYQMLWGRYIRTVEAVDLRTFGTFMDETVDDAYAVTSYTGESKARQSKPERSKPDRSFVHSDVAGKFEKPKERSSCQGAAEFRKRVLTCAVCQKEGHKSRECRSFQKMTVDDRWLRIQNLGLCKTCLYSHGTRSCRNNTRCGVDGCDARHHALLHSAEKPKASYSSGPNPTSNYVVHHVHQSSFPSLLYRVIPITLHNGSLSVDSFAFIDEGSSITMLEKSLAEKLQLNGHSQPLCLQWTSNVTRIENDSKRVTFEISGINKSKRYKVSNVGTTNSLNLPTQSLPFEELKSRFSHLRGIPVDGYENASPQLLIGVDNLRLVVPLKAREGEVGDPTAVRTRLGWCVYGGKRDESTPTFSYHICDCQHDSSLDEAVKTYLTLDEVGSKVFTPVLSDEDTRATKIMQETTKRVGDRYESGLLWKYDFVEFPDSYPMCLRRLQCLERRMGKEPAMRDNIVRQIEEYQQKGYCHRATPDELQQADPRRTWYLPLGAVTNPKKPGKVRLIWDAAAKVDGVSLNAMLLKGPDQLTSLPAVLFRFRQYPVAVCGDIREMYHQILIREADRSAQRFLWRSDPNQQPEVFVMDVATFGSTSSPATAQYVKNINARLFADQYPAAVEEAISGHYVDDYVTSFRSVAEAKEVTSRVRAIHQHGGFELRQFCSNSDEVMQFLGEVKAHPVKNMCPTKGENSERVLGILWDTEHDELRFPTKMREDMVKLITTQEKPTKRQILRCVMTMFDPLGLLAPYLIFGKIIIQEAWRKELGWDEPVDDETHQQWLKWVQMLEHINDIGIQRCYFREAINEVEVHTFVDASEIAYSCVTYFRSTNAAGEVKVALVGAKSKVAPLKAWSIPRLELQACVLGARHMRSVIEGHSLQIKKRVLWSDSGTALSWINGDPRKFN
ncbi:uncharacterized protein LOC129741371 [Uranotaenia lowii]|uniref:uncharacterized protein LOC129741371 n=1 Tax=Uranotaenia lowii TaxID=190385 RepID=UPI0024796EAA|nr:uncharacterized protein LOC129741371 [Uranotaenia lowii]